LLGEYPEGGRGAFVQLLTLPKPTSFRQRQSHPHQRK
jgi:hypothetical protein